MSKVTPILTLDMIPIQKKLYKALKTPFELFLVKRSTDDRVGYSIAYMDDLDGSGDILCTSYIWMDRQKALKKLFDLVADEDNLTIRLT